MQVPSTSIRNHICDFIVARMGVVLVCDVSSPYNAVHVMCVCMCNSVFNVPI